MKYFIRIYPVSRHQSAVVKLILRILGPSESKKAKELAKAGGIITENLNKEAASNFANQLRELGTQVEVAEMNQDEDFVYEVKLTSVGEGKLVIVKVVKEMTGLGLQESKQIVDDLGIVAENLSKEAAEKIKSNLEANGATAAIRQENEKPIDNDKKDATSDIVSRSNIKLIFDSTRNNVVVETHSGHRLEISEKKNSLVLKDQNGNEIILRQNGIKLV